MTLGAFWQMNQTSSITMNLADELGMLPHAPEIARMLNSQCNDDSARTSSNRGL